MLLLVQLFLVAGIVAASGQAESTASSDEQMEISIVNWDMQYSFPEGDVEDPMRDFFEDRFNITIKPYSVGWGDYNEKMNIWAASGELPDVMGAVDTVGKRFLVICRHIQTFRNTYRFLTFKERVSMVRIIYCHG